jgi:glycosyltransferase involved in cell wall biosynthesis
MATYAGLAALLFKKKVQSVPYILTLQSGDSDLFIWLRTWFWYPWYRQIYTRANHITAISNWLKERARKYGYKGEVSIVPNGVDLEYFSKKISAEHRISIRNIWDAKDSDTVVVTTSRLVHKNGVDILINAVRYLPESVKLVIAGTGEDEEKLLTLSREFHKRIKFIGHISHKKLPEILQSSDIFVRPSRSEGMGNSFIEAKAAGLPVLGTDVGGIKDLINDNIVDPIKENSEKAVAEKIKQIMDISENNQKGNDSLVKYSWNNITQKYEQVYKKLKK